MSNQYEVLGKAPTPEDLKKLSPDEIHLTIKNLNAGYGKMEILHNFDLFVNKAQSLCLIGPNGACLLYTSPSPRDISGSRMPSSA